MVLYYFQLHEDTEGKLQSVSRAWYPYKNNLPDLCGGVHHEPACGICGRNGRGIRTLHADTVLFQRYDKGNPDAGSFFRGNIGHWVSGFSPDRAVSNHVQPGKHSGDGEFDRILRREETRADTGKGTWIRNLWAPFFRYWKRDLCDTGMDGQSGQLSCHFAEYVFAALGRNASVYEKAEKKAGCLPEKSAEK